MNLRCLVPALALLLTPIPASAQDALLAESDSEQTANVLKELVRIESALLADAEAERAAGLDRLRAAADRLSRASTGLTSALDGLALARLGAADAGAARTALREAEGTLSTAQSEVERQVGESRGLARRLSDHVARLEGLQQRLRSLEEDAPSTRGELAGVWDLTISPNSDRGSLMLRQFGTLVAGRYRLASGREGSVRGTFASGTLRLEVIDSRYGRDATYHGLYHPERGLSGTWEAAKLGTGRPAFGDWRAVKREEAAPEATP